MIPAAPRLRFPEFKEPWKPTAVSTLLERQSIPVEVDPTQTYRQIGVRSHGKGVFHKEAVTGAELGDKRVFHVVPDALVVNIVFAWEQAVALTSDAEAGFVASHRFPMFTEKGGKSYLPFLRQMFLTKRGKLLLEMASPGGAGRNKTLGQQEFLKLKPIVPSRAEQKKIADAIGAVDAKLAALAAKQAALGRFKAGLMQKLFSQQLRFTRDDGQGFPDWEEKRLGDIVDYEQPTKYLVSSTDYSDDFTTPVLTAGKTLILGYTDETHGIYNGPLPVIIFDDFTTASKFVDFPFKAKSSAMKILRPRSDDVKIKLVFEFLQMMNFSPDSHQRHWISRFSEMQVLFPCPDEQQKIANALSAMDTKIQAVADQVTSLQTFKKGLLQQMFV